MKTNQLKIVLVSLFVFVILFGAGYSVQTPKISLVEMTDNGILTSFATGNVNRGTLYKHTYGGDAYGQGLYVEIYGNETGACATFANITLNVTLSYDNVPFVLETGARYAGQNIGGSSLCYDTTQGDYFQGILGGGNVFAPSQITTNFQSCDYNRLSETWYTNHTQGSYCNSHGETNALPDGSAILNLLLWDYTTGVIYDNQTLYFIEGCETGCFGAPTSKVLNLNPYFNANRLNWNNEFSPVPASVISWVVNYTPPTLVTRFGELYTYASAHGKPALVLSDSFLANSTKYSILVQTSQLQSFNCVAGSSKTCDVTNQVRDSSLNVLSTWGTGCYNNICSTIGAIASMSKPVSYFNSDYRLYGGRVSPAVLVSKGTSMQYHIYHGSIVNDPYHYGAEAVSYADYLIARQYVPSIRYLLSTTASGVAGTSAINMSFLFSECSESTTRYACRFKISNGTDDYYADAGTEYDCVAHSSVGDTTTVSNVPDGIWNVSTQCFVDGDINSVPYTSNKVSVVVSQFGSQGLINITFTNPPSDGYSYPLPFNLTNKFTPAINVVGCASTCLSGSSICEYNTYVDENLQSSGMFQGDGVKTLLPVYTDRLNSPKIAIGAKGDHIVRVDVGCQDRSGACLIAGNCSLIGTGNNPIKGSALVNFRTGNYTTLNHTLDSTTLNFKPSLTQFDHSDLPVSVSVRGDALCPQNIMEYEVLIDGSRKAEGYSFGGDTYSSLYSAGYTFSKGTHSIMTLGRCTGTSYVSTSKMNYFVVGSNATSLLVNWNYPTVNQSINSTSFEGLFSIKGCTAVCSTQTCGYYLFSDGLTLRTGLLTEGNWSVRVTTPVGIGYHTLGALAYCPDNSAKRGSSTLVYWGELNTTSTPLVQNQHLQTEVVGGKLDTQNTNFFLDSTGAYDIQPKWYNWNRPANMRMYSDIAGTCQVIREDARLFRQTPMALSKIRLLVEESIQNYQNTLLGYNCTSSILGTRCFNETGTELINQQESSWGVKLLAFFKMIFLRASWFSPSTQNIVVVNNTATATISYLNTTYYFDPATPFVTNEVIFALDVNELSTILSDLTVRGQFINCEGLNISFVGTSVDKLLHPAYGKCFRADYEQTVWGESVIATMNLEANKWSTWKINEPLLTRDINAKLKAGQHEMSEQGSSAVRLDESDFETHLFTRLDCNFNGILENQEFQFLTVTRNYTPRPLLSLGTLFLLSWFAPVILMVFMLLQNGARGREGG